MKTPDYTMTNFREDYSARIKLQLDEFNSKVDQLEEKIHEANTEARASYRIELAKLRLQSEQATDTLHQLRADGAATWDQMVREMDKVRNAFSHALNDFKSQF